MIELDHIFVLTKPQPESSNRLVEIGMEEGPSRIHKGQGTTNRQFKFSNFKLEFLWVHDKHEHQTGPAKGLALFQRTVTPDASPFGLIFTPTQKDLDKMPFGGWAYQPEYFPPPMSFHIGENSESLDEPLCIYAPFGPIDREIQSGRFKTVDRIKIQTPSSALSQTLVTVNAIDNLQVSTGDDHLMEIWFNESQGECIDLRPELPLVIYG